MTAEVMTLTVAGGWNTENESEVGTLKMEYYLIEVEKTAAAIVVEKPAATVVEKPAALIS